jgi:hypothetical protein
MNLRDYKWSFNPRGLHNNGVYKVPILDRYVSPHMGWVKLVTGSDDYLTVIPEIVGHGMTPIVRIFLPETGAEPPAPEWDAMMSRYISMGVLWFELYNEPNQGVEWPKNENGDPIINLTYKNRTEIIKPLMDNWLVWAERVIALGAYPAFPAMTDTTEPELATTLWLEACLSYLAETNYQRFVNVANNGMWKATHPYILNHFYQRKTGAAEYTPRAYQQLKGAEAGWHFEYPYDPLQQHYDPGRTVFGGTKLTPYGDPNGLLSTGEVFQQLVKKYFNIGPIPVVGTEGGIDVPSVDGLLQFDRRYPPFNLNAHAEATLAMFRWIATQGPPWFWGLTLWLEDLYYPEGEPIPAINKLIAEPPLLKVVPNVDTSSGTVYDPRTGEQVGLQPQDNTIDLPGPGPVSGTSVDYHWLVLAPGLQADWFFVAANRYWQTFRPTVLAEWELIASIPTDKSAAVTVLARPDTIAYMDEKVRDRWPNIYYDPVVFDTMVSMQAELDRRATQLKRFG